MYLAPKRKIEGMTDATIQRVLPDWKIVTEEDLALSEKQRREFEQQELLAMELSPGEHHLLIAEYDFDGTVEEAEHLIEDGDTDIELLYRFAHPRDCITACRKAGDSEACGVNWLVGYVGVEDALGQWDSVPVPTEPGTWEIEFVAEGHGDDVTTWLAFIEDDK